ncbi:MAG: hypothetical protein AAFN10_04330 [Bacteroidota bacterium]
MKRSGMGKKGCTNPPLKPLSPEKTWDLLISHMLRDEAFFPKTEPGVLLRHHSLKLEPIAVLLQSERALVPQSGRFEPTPLPFGPAARLALRWIQYALSQSPKSLLLTPAPSPASFAPLAEQSIAWEAVAEQVRRLAYLRLRVGQLAPQTQGQLLRFSLVEEITFPQPQDRSLMQLWLSPGFRQGLMREMRGQAQWRADPPANAESLKDEEKGVRTKASAASFCA